MKLKVGDQIRRKLTKKKTRKNNRPIFTIIEIRQTHKLGTSKSDYRWGNETYTMVQIINKKGEKRSIRLKGIKEYYEKV